MTAPTQQPYAAPSSPIATHITVALGGAGALVGLAALVLMLCVITLGLPTAAMNFTAVLGATLAGCSCMVWTGQRVIQHHTACYQANRAASKAEVGAALKKVHKEVEAMRDMSQAAELARVTAAIRAQEAPRQLGVINGGGGSGMG